MRAKSTHRRATAWLTALIACAAGASRGQNEPQPAIPAAIAAPASPAGNPQPSVNYRLMPKDTVHIKVFQEDDLETTARIDRDGIIFFPLLGKAKIGGETQQEATATMESLLKEYLVNPQVSVEIISYAKKQFAILDQVNKPGIYDIPDEGSLNLLEAIAMAGGYSKIANPSKIIIKRIVNGQETIIRVDGKRLLDKHNTSVPIPDVQSGDTIDVGEAIF